MAFENDTKYNRIAKDERRAKANEIKMKNTAAKYDERLLISFLQEILLVK